MKIFTYTVVFEKAHEGGYIAHVPVLPGCSTQGETFEEAKENAKDAIAGYIEVLQEDGDEIPVERIASSPRKIRFCSSQTNRQSRDPSSSYNKTYCRCTNLRPRY